MAVQLLVKGVDVTGRLAPWASGSATVGFTTPMPGQRSASTFTLRSLPSEALYLPEPGDSVQWLDSGDIRFNGSIDNVHQKLMMPVPPPGAIGDGYLYDCTCVSLEQRLDKRFITGVFIGETTGAIVQALLAGIIGDEGITAGTIGPGVSVPTLIYNKPTRLSDVLTSLAGSSGYVWYIDP